MHLPNMNLRRNTKVIDNSLIPCIVLDDMTESPIRIIRKGHNIISAWADELEEVDTIVFLKAVLIKHLCPVLLDGA